MTYLSDGVDLDKTGESMPITTTSQQTNTGTSGGGGGGGSSSITNIINLYNITNIIKEENKEKSEESKSSQEGTKPEEKLLTGITGAVIVEVAKASPIIGTIIILSIVLIGLTGYKYYRRHRY